jgi:hypothetical protein
VGGGRRCRRCGRAGGRRPQDAAPPGFYAGFDSGCQSTTPVLAYRSGEVLGGNFRDDTGGCYVWLNLARAALLNGQEICKIALHEMGHYIDDVMYAPFQPQPVPGVCGAPIGRPDEPA